MNPLLKNTEEKRGDASASASLTVVAGATMLALVVFTIPLTAMAATVKELGTGASGQAWILSGMPLGAAAGLLGAGAWGDNRGRKGVFLLGLLGLFLSSILGALAPVSLVLIIARVLQGLSCSAVLACGLGIIGQVFPRGSGRVRAAGIWAAGLGAGVAVGPILTAALLPLGGWRASHWSMAVFALPLLLAGKRYLPQSDVKSRERIDVEGSVVLMAGMATFLAALTEARMGMRLLVLLLLGLGLLLFGLFLLIELRSRNPILQLSLFRRADFVGVTMGAFASGAGILSIMTLVPTVLERSLGVHPMSAAMVLVVCSAMTAVTALGTKHIQEMVTPRVLLLLSMAGCGLGQLLLLMIYPGGSVWLAMPGMFLAGVSNGVLNAALGHQAVQSVPHHRTAMGSAANNTARYLGSSIGITIAAVLIGHGAEVGGQAGLFNGWRWALFVSVGFTLVGACTVFFTQEAKEVPELCPDSAE